MTNSTSSNSLLIRRILAALTDFSFFLVILMIYNFISGNAPTWENGLQSYIVQSIPGFFIVVIVWFLYFPLLESIFGYTLGKGLFDLEVVRERRNDFPLSVSLKRHLLDPFDFFAFGVPAILMVALSPDHKRLGDRWAHSQVLLEGTRIPIPMTPDKPALTSEEQVRYGGFWLRFGANLLDALVMIPLIAIALLVLVHGTLWTKLVAEAILGLLSVLYVVGFHAKYGATLGKMATGLQVLRLDFTRIGWKEAFMRSIVDVLLLFFTTIGNVLTILAIPPEEFHNISIWEVNKVLAAHQSIILTICSSLYTLWYRGEVFTLLFNRKRRALHDFIAGTVVVEKDTLPATQSAE